MLLSSTLTGKNNSVQLSKVPEGSMIIGLLTVCSLGFSLKQKFNP
ncbi:PEP-CTERM sorting domain-containing protein [Nostoc sp.]